MKDYLNKTRQQLSLNLQNEFQSLKVVCQQMLQRLQAMLGSSGKAIKDGFQNLKLKFNGSHQQEPNLNERPTMKKVWQLHILDPRVTPRKETFLTEIQRLIRKKFKNNRF
jgi:hypothetical protein